MSLLEQDPPMEQQVDQDLAGTLNLTRVALELGEAHTVETGSLTAVLPVTSTSILTLRNTLSPVLNSPSCVSKVLVVCPESLLAQARLAVRLAVRDAPESDHHPDISLSPWNGDPVAAVLHAVPQLSTERILLLDDTGFSGLSDRTREMLLCPIAADLPVGPRGVTGSAGNLSCALPSIEIRPASYLLPPFFLPSSLVQEVYEDWADLGHAVSGSREDRLGGILRGLGDPDSNWCNIPQYRTSYVADLFTPSSSDPFSTKGGLFVFLLPDINTLRVLLQFVCRVQESGNSIKILLYSEPRTLLGQTHNFNCRVQYDATSVTGYPTIPDWLDRLEREAEVIFTVDEPATQAARSERATIVRIPRDDLPYAYWMGSLSLAEWKCAVLWFYSPRPCLNLHGLTDWHVPQIQISIITQDRPQSLERLLSSLTRGRYFGDSVSLRMNMEQSSNLETIRVVDAYQWSHGTVFAHRRVVHGGLLPAVVESWYPHSNDSYGILLEDDVELSPLFYAWIKMGILRYRYGEARNQAAPLFGISLYQQKNIELHPDGRRPFDARKLFAENNIPDPSTPYLSQIPCSWGAVYFPEHWREFHTYLANRLSETTMEIERIVVPDVRSNNWTKSWKKYFIEMVHMRGYVMLYPNYARFVSLSTNHLEIGSHVKDRPKDKQEAFMLPLMDLGSSVHLLDLPGGRLPEWDALPALNLTGFLVSL
ncbi:Succinate dehydrogenase [ubiquinone] iron-sulfur subunit, mitochondrial [Mycena sanguinolenta]|uniref:Succinate dehydrogenase [ubiquinone] iron-sulfur subunit, mitochondrial n=1 Tax=Mycena sanguinolenta TaxID=230812 RepID=A0A8H6Z172_9AGAR|nr:Succinate dehydrogenase [ubiquinone] iron-sulfur subunit, mitochondrial [Mycena sanguinolenta]